jgi:hypothetical protein
MKFQYTPCAQLCINCADKDTASSQALVVSWEGHDFERACGIL